MSSKFVCEGVERREGSRTQLFFRFRKVLKATSRFCGGPLGNKPILPKNDVDQLIPL